MQITLRYKKSVKGYARFSIPGGGMAVFSANLFGKGVEPPARIVLEHDAFAVQEPDQLERERAEKAAAKAAEIASKALARAEKAAARLAALNPTASSMPEQPAVESDASDVPEGQEEPVDEMVEV